MTKRITIFASLLVVLASCGPALINTLVKINTGEAKRFAKTVIADPTGDISKFPVSKELREYIESDEGKIFFQSVESEFGELKKMKLEGLKGANTDTMNYRFIARFKGSEVEKKINVQSYQDKEIVAIQIGFWETAID